MLLSVTVANKWKIKSGDIKNTYLQGEKLDKKAFMEPP